MKISLFSFILILATVFQAQAQGAADTVQKQLLRGELALDPTPIRLDQFNYEVIGDPAKPWLVLIHGLGGSSQSWQNIKNDLAKDFRVLIYDQRGHGASGVDSENFSSMTMAHDLKTLMDFLKIDRAHLTGHSMGGRTAMRFAAAYPERTISVTIEDMHMMGRSKLLPDNLDLSRSIKPLYQTSFKSAEEFYGLYQPFMKWTDHDDIYNFGHTDGRTGRFILHFKPHTNLLYYAQGLQEDLTEPLKAVRAPILFLAADTDPVLYGKGIDHIRLNRPDAEIVTIRHSSHTIHSSNRQAFLREFGRFSKGASCQAIFN